MKRILLPLMAAVVLFASCNQYEKTPTGLKYKIDRGSSKDLLKQGQFVKMHVSYTLAGKDSSLSTSFGHIPVYFQVDSVSAARSKHNFVEILTKLAPGDKAEFVMSVDSLKNMGMLEYNNIFKQKDNINGKAEILKTFTNQDEMMADYQKEMKLEVDREDKEVQDFIKSKGAKAKKTASGAYVEITEPGVGPKADSGMQISVLYRGTFTDGKRFDGNMDKDSPNKEPLRFVIGTESVIKGMDETLREFAKGGKGKLFVPAMLGYGPNGRAPVVPAYKTLCFDIEVLDVSKPAPAPVPAGPQGAQFPPQGQQ
ncbi:MAG: hypothetical protein EAZ62_09035 [Sphingobacteriia bacterium]|nr:MAG: hypothetical protein EAZ62_09035 [Sphingobacteriia bacterium]